MNVCSQDIHTKEDVSLLVLTDTGVIPLTTNVNHVTNLVLLVLVDHLIVAKPVQSEAIGKITDVSIHVPSDPTLTTTITSVIHVTNIVILVTEDNTIIVKNVQKEDTSIMENA